MIPPESVMFMTEATNGICSKVHSKIRVKSDGKVHKTFCGESKKERFETEVRVLQELEGRDCDFVPRLLEKDDANHSIVTTNCGQLVQYLSEERTAELFEHLKEEFGIVHGDPIPDNVTFDPHRGRFCLINFENAEILGRPVEFTKASVLRWQGNTRSGMRKKDNEDSLSVFSIKHGWAKEKKMHGSRKLKSGNLVFVVSDGMGGHAGGAVASGLVVSHLQSFLPAMIGQFDGVGSPSALLENAILTLHTHVLRIGDSRPEVSDMGATVVCGLFWRGELHFGHLGDSRLYRFRDGRLSQLTDDHSFVGKLQLEGKISEREARINPRRNILTQAIGAQCEHIHPQVGSTRVRVGDWYLICSDGLVDGLWDKHIEQEFLMAGLVNNTPEGVCSHLLDRAYSEAGRDDTTLFVIKAE